MSLTMFKVGSKTNVQQLSDAITIKYETGEDFEVSAIGAGSVNQAIKSIAIAKSKLAKLGINVLVDMYFKDVEGLRADRAVSSICFKLIETEE